MTRRPRNEPPVIAPKDGLRQRQRTDGTWRVWWEPTRQQRAAGATPVEMSAAKPGQAQRDATRLARDWAALVDGRPAPSMRGGRSVSMLIEDYRASRFFTSKRPSTRNSYGADLRAIERKWGPQPLALLDEVMMDSWYDALLSEKGVFRARAILTMMRTLLKHAERRKWRPRGSNPVRDMEMQRPPPRGRVGTWPELLALLIAARRMEAQSMTPAGQLRWHGARGRLVAQDQRPENDRMTWRGLRLAILLTALGGQRQTDVLKARPEEFTQVQAQIPGLPGPRRVWAWGLVRSKRNNEGVVALHPEIVPLLRTQLLVIAAGRGPGVLIWDEATGKAFVKRLFWDRWSAVRDLAAKSVPSVATIQWRDLRRTFGHLARAGGADKGDVADVLGNTADTDPVLAQVYMAPSLVTTWRAAAAIQRPAEIPEAAALKERKKA